MNGRNASVPLIWIRTANIKKRKKETIIIAII